MALASRLRAQPAKLRPKPNLLVFLPDQLRADTIVGEQASRVHAPNLHKLASQAVVFERAYVTQPICAPSRSSLLSGTWPHANGCTNNKSVLPRKFLCLPELLGDSDYRNGYFGKWHLGDEFSAQRGFQEWISILESFKTVERKHHAQRRWISIVEHLKLVDGKSHTDAVSDYTKFLLSRGYQPDAHKGKYFSEEFASRVPFELSKPKFLETKACDFLERHAGEPFVLVVAFFEPHPPYSGPFNNEHSLDTIQLDRSVEDVLGEEIPLRFRLMQEFYRKRVGGPERYREAKQKYFGLITEIDHCIGAILTKLEDLGVNDRTITVLTSDHGDMMTAHGLFGKELMLEQSANVPYVVRVPGQSPGRCSQPISHIDFAPTMLDLLGKPPHAQCVGRSRRDLIRGENSPPESVFLEWSPGKLIAEAQSSIASREEIRRCFGESSRAVVSPDGWKLCLRDKDKNELYNLREDSDERHNFYYDNAHRDVVNRLTEEIHRWQQRVGDTLKI